MPSDYEFYSVFLWPLSKGTGFSVIHVRNTRKTTQIREKCAKNHQKGGGFYRFIILRGSQTWVLNIRNMLPFFWQKSKGTGFSGIWPKKSPRIPENPGISQKKRDFDGFYFRKSEKRRGFPGFDRKNTKKNTEIPEISGIPRIPKFWSKFSDRIWHAQQILAYIRYFIDIVENSLGEFLLEGDFYLKPILNL